MQHLPLQDTVMQEVVADTPNALTTAAEASVAAALHADTTIWKTNSIILLMPFLSHSLLFWSIDPTITMTWVLNSQTLMWNTYNQ